MSDGSPAACSSKYSTKPPIVPFLMTWGSQSECRLFRATWRECVIMDPLDILSAEDWGVLEIATLREPVGVWLCPERAEEGSQGWEECSNGEEEGCGEKKWLEGHLASYSPSSMSQGIRGLWVGDIDEDSTLRLLVGLNRFDDVRWCVECLELPGRLWAWMLCLWELSWLLSDKEQRGGEEVPKKTWSPAVVGLCALPARFKSSRTVNQLVENAGRAFLH